jgi:AmmeMemoRadiSam system protein B
MMENVRPSAVAGSWYPGSAAAIVREVDRYLESALAPVPAGRLVGLIAPHAGLRYSGPVAAYGYNLLRARRPATVVIVGPSHRVAFRGVAVHARGAWETPLGRIVIDEDAADAIMAAAPEMVLDEPDLHRGEHSLEMQLPFVQRLLPEARLLPLLMGTQSGEAIEGLAAALAGSLRGRDALLVASSDLSHYEPAVVANRVDGVVTECIARFDDRTLQQRLDTHDNVACGGGPIVAVMRAARGLGAETSVVLRYGDSGDVEARDKSHVVGYVSAALLARES